MDERRVNVRAIVWRDGKILAVKHKKANGEETKYWAVPGGGLDPLESLHDGVKRELLEEVGLNATVGELLFIQQYQSKREGFKEELEFFFHIEDSEHLDAIDLEATTHGSLEIARVAFVDPKEVLILPKILSELDIEKAINTPTRVFISNQL